MSYYVRILQRMAVLSTLLSKGLGTVLTQVNMVNMVHLNVVVVNTDIV